VDDGSTDDTRPVMQALAAGDPRIRCVAQANQGRSAARNHGAAEARGEYLAFLDSDDTLLPGALDAHLARMRAHPGTAITIGGYVYVDACGQVLGERRPWEESPPTFDGWLFNCLAMPGSALIQREAFQQQGGFDRACEIAEDWDLFLRLAQAGERMVYVHAPVCRYRLHPGNSTATARALHFEGSRRALDKVFASPQLPAPTAALRPRALGWLGVSFARRAFGAGEASEGRAYLELALASDPGLAGARRPALLEFLLAAPPGAGEAVQAFRQCVIGHLPPALHGPPGELRRATARAEMGAFFRHARSGTPDQAWRHLRAALRLDPGWLANRGVVSFLVRQSLRPRRARR
jgi:hypothetical protein